MTTWHSWFDNMSLVTSDYLFAMAPQGGASSVDLPIGHHHQFDNHDRRMSGFTFWRATAPRQFRTNWDEHADVDLLEGRNFLVALDLGSGKTVWKQPFDLSNCQHIVYVNYAQGKLVVSGNRYVNRSLWYFFQALDASNGPERVERQSRLGSIARRRSRRAESASDDCGRHRLYLSAGLPPAHRPAASKAGDSIGSDTDAETSRPRPAASSGAVETRGSGICRPDRKPVRINSVNRPGCFINIIPAGGMLLIPEASSGCTCGFPLQTSLAYVPAELRSSRSVFQLFRHLCRKRDPRSQSTLAQFTIPAGSNRRV